MSHAETPKPERPWATLQIVLASVALLTIVAWFVVGKVFKGQIQNIDLVAGTATKYVQAALDGDVTTMTNLGRHAPNIDLAAQSHLEVSQDLRAAVGPDAKAVALGLNSKQTEKRFEYHVAVSIAGAAKSRKVDVLILVFDDQPQVFWTEIKD